MANPEIHLLEISAVRQLTDDAVGISFAVPSHLESAFEFIPGQYLTLLAEIDGEEVRRSYSICSALGDDLEVGIKRLEGGLFSTYAAALSMGDQLRVMTPQGNFKAETGGQHRYLLIAAGSGITPCLSIAKSVFDHEPHSGVDLIYGNRTTSSVMFREDLNELKDRYTDRFMLTHILSGEQQGVDGLSGRIDGDKLKRFQQQGLIDVDRYDGIYLCGPFTMVEQCRLVLKELGVADAKVHFELFTTADVPQAVVQSNAKKKVVESSSVSVKIILDGAQRDIAVDASQETVLTAARRAGMDLPFSCAGGMCCTCRCKVVSGSTTMDLNFSLADWEVESGFTLACQTRPHDSNVVLDFDAS